MEKTGYLLITGERISSYNIVNKLTIMVRMKTREGIMEISILQAKTDFSKLIRLLESQQEDSIIVARHGKPVAKIIRYQKPDVSGRIGILKGQPYISMTQEEFDRDNDKIAKIMMDGEL